MGCQSTNSRPQQHANRLRRRRAAVPAMRCSASCSRANGAARCIAVALALMWAAQVSPGPTRTAAEPTASPIAAVVSTDIDENGRVCGVGTRRLLLCATRMHRVHHVQCGAAGVNGLLIAALTASAHADRPCH